MGTARRTRARTETTAETALRIVQMRTLQSAAPAVVKATAEHAVEVRRYGDTVAFVVSPEQYRRSEALERALERAVWAYDVERAIRNVKEGRTTDWDEAVARLRAELA